MADLCPVCGKKVGGLTGFPLPGSDMKQKGVAAGVYVEGMCATCLSRALRGEGPITEETIAKGKKPDAIKTPGLFFPAAIGCVAFTLFSYVITIYLHIYLWILFAVPIAMTIAGVLGFGVFLAVLWLNERKFGEIFSLLLLIALPIGTYYFDGYAKQLKDQESKKEALEKEKRRSETKREKHVPRNCDVKASQEAIALVLNGGFAERREEGFGSIVWYDWQKGWSGMSKEQRYSLLSGLGAAERCLSGKATYINVAGKTVARARLSGKIEVE